MSFDNRGTTLLLIAASVAHPALGLSTDKDQPIYLEADSVEIDEVSGVSTYQGNVIVTQGSLKLWADKMWIHRKNGITEKIVTRGEPTHFRQRWMMRTRRPEAAPNERNSMYKRMKSISTTRRLLEQKQDKFRSDRIIFLRSKSLVKAGASAQGKQRVHVTIESEQPTP